MRRFLKFCLVLACLFWPRHATGADAGEVTGEKIEEVLAAYSGTSTFEGRFKFFENPGTTLCDTAGACVQYRWNGRGHIWFSEPFKLKLDYVYEETHLGDKPMDDGDEPMALHKFFMTNGVISWDNSPWSTSRPGATMRVNKDRITLQHWKEGSPDEPPEESWEREEPEDADARRAQLALTASGLGERRGSPFKVVPSYLLAPFRGISRDRISYAGEESVAGVACLRFFVEGTAGSGDSRHWISRKDGVVRRLEEFYLKSDTLRRRFEISSVVINNELDDGLFEFAGDGRHQVADVQEFLERERRQFREAQKRYPAALLEKHFDRPAKGARGLRGVLFTGFLDKAGFIRFRGDDRIALKERAEFQEVGIEDAEARGVHEFLAELFPEDQEALAEKPGFLILRWLQRRDGNRRDLWFFHHRKRNLYFFVARYVG